MHSSVLIREHLLSEKLAFALDGYSRANAFTKEDSPEPMHPQSPTRYLKKLSDHCGLPDLRPHKLRHTFASVAITNGADVANVSEALGHSDKAVTLRMYQRRELIVGQTAETGVLPHVESLTAALEPHAGQQDFGEFDMRHSAASEATLVAVEGSVSASLIVLSLIRHHREGEWGAWQARTLPYIVHAGR